MLLVKPSVEIIHVGTDICHLLQEAGRTCYKSEGKIDGTAEQAEGFVKMLLNRGHESVIEHASATVRFICDRGVSHEIVRHRLASYSQESTRYCDYENGHVAFVIPPWCSLETGVIDTDNFCSLDERIFAIEQDRQWASAMWSAEFYYKTLRQRGWHPEQARSVLPNSLKTEVVMTANLREWRHFFKLRTAAAAHPQMREVACPLLAQFRAAMPVVFDDVGTTESRI